MVLPPVPPAPRRPKRPPPRPPKKKKDEEKIKSLTASAGSAKTVTLTEAERIQVDIIDWKRCSIRALLILAYCTLAYFIVNLCIVGYGYRIVQQSYWLTLSMYGFLFNLMLYFFGAGESIIAISHVWSFSQFVLGVVFVVIGMCLNIGLYFIGITTTDKITKGVPNQLIENCANTTLRNETAINELSNKDPDANKDFLIEVEKLKLICKLVDSKMIEKTLSMMPFIIPPIALVCTVTACVCAYFALKVVPEKFKKGKIDAKYVEPYQTYDFYVGHGRNVPKVVGVDYGVEEHSHVVNLFPGEEDETVSGVRSREERRASQNIRLSRGSGAGTTKTLLQKSKLGVPTGAKRNVKGNANKLGGGTSGKVIPGIKKRN